MTGTLVICDDDRVTRQVIGGLARNVGFDLVGEVGVALDAVELVERLAPDVLVLDVAMPGLSGIDVLLDVKMASPATKTVIVSSFDVADSEALERGAHAVIDKTDFDALERVLGELAATLPS